MLREVLIQKGLSNREAEVSELCAKGLSNLEIGHQLFVTERTIKFHLQNIYKKMGLKSRAQLIVWCLPHTPFVSEEVYHEKKKKELTRVELLDLLTQIYDEIPAKGAITQLTYNELKSAIGE